MRDWYPEERSGPQRSSPRWTPAEQEAYEAWMADPKNVDAMQRRKAERAAVARGEVTAEEPKYNPRLWNRHKAGLAAGESSRLRADGRKKRVEEQIAAADARGIRFMDDFRARGGEGATRSGAASIIRDIAAAEKISPTAVRHIIARGRDLEMVRAEEAE